MDHNGKLNTIKCAIMPIYHPLTRPKFANQKNYFHGGFDEQNNFNGKLAMKMIIIEI